MACWLLQKDEKRQDASAITTEQWILPPPPLSVEVFPAKVSQLAKVPSCQAECTYPSATESMVERADSNWKWNLWMGKCESSKRSCHNRPVPISEQTQWGHIVFSFSPPSATLQKVEQSVLRFLRMRMRLKTIFSWVSEDEDEVENNLSLSFWGWPWKQSVLGFLRMMMSMRSSFKTLIYDQQVYIVCVYRLPTLDHLYQKLLS